MLHMCMKSPVICAVLMVIYFYNTTKVAAQNGYTCSPNMAAVCPGTYVVCTCTISAPNSLYNQWNISHELCESTINGSIQLNRIGVLCSNEYQNCGSDIRAWNEPSNNSTECETSTILIRASQDLDGLAFECQDGTNGSNGTPTSYGRTVLSVISAPDNPKITNVKSDNPTMLTIEWSPAVNGSHPSSFNVTISNYGDNVPLNTASIAFEKRRRLPYSYTFTGLVSDSDYNVSVVSINCAGISSTVHQAGVISDDAFKEGAIYVGVFLACFMLASLLCAAIFYKYRKITTIRRYETLPSTPPTEDRPSTPPTEDRPSTPPTEDLPSAPHTENHLSTPPTGNRPSTPPTEDRPSTPPTGNRPSTPPTEDRPSTPPTEGRPSAPTTGVYRGGESLITLRKLHFLNWIDPNGKRQTLDIITRACKEYNKLGMLLLNDDNLHLVKTLENKHNNDSRKVTLDIFTKWIDGNFTPVTWPALINVLQDVELKCLADDIKKALEHELTDCAAPNPV